MNGIRTATLPRTSRPVKRRRGGRPIDVAVGLAGLGLGATIGLAVDSETAGALHAPGGVPTFVGELFGLAGAYLMLLMLLLVARVPWVERAAGQDRLVRWHRNLGQWPVYLLCLHAILVTVGYADQSHVSVVRQFDTFITSYPDVLASTVALGLIILASVLSIRRIRSHMRYETWWSVHLYLYLALALAFAHQIANGLSFIGHPLTRALWGTLWGATAGVVLVFRFILPLARSFYHRVEVVGFQVEAPGVVSVICRGRHLDRLRVEGGQFFQWRFLARGMWWQAHPYSLSALPRSEHIRLTVKDQGDHSGRMRRLPLGTKVVIEGPYGAFTRHARGTDRVLLVGGGVGLTPIRALLEHLDPGVDVEVVLRFSKPEHRFFAAEFESLVENRQGHLHELVGPRRKHALDPRHLRHLVPDIADRDVYVCGPDSLNQQVIASARQLGVDQERIHCEQFTF